MSLFQAREWCSTCCGGIEEEFDQGGLCLANIDNNPNGYDKVIVGSLNGVIRIFTAEKGGFKANNLMLETQLGYPIIQVEAGRFVSGSEKIQLAVLHPRSLCVYAVSSVVGFVEQSQFFSTKLIYEHRLEHVSSSMVYGPFGGVKDKDFICILSMDGVLRFYEQETFSFQAFLPDFLLPGPFVYISSKDSFVFGVSDRSLQCYKYGTLASSSVSDKNAKKILPDWSKMLGEHLVSIQFSGGSIEVLGERSLFTINISGEIVHMKKLEYSPNCLLSYTKPSSSDVKINLVCTYSSMLLVYEDHVLIWAAQLPHDSVSCKIGNFDGLQGVIVTLNEHGYIFCSYLGTTPSLFTIPKATERENNFDALKKELKGLNKFIQASESGTDLSTVVKEPLSINVVLPEKLDETSKSQELIDNDGDHPISPSITVEIILEWKSLKPVENVTLCCSSKHPIICSQPQICIPILGNKCALNVFFCTLGSSLPSDLDVSITASYLTDSEAPRVVQMSFELPLDLIAFGSPPLKTGINKLVIEVNKDTVNLGEIFPDMVEDAVIPISGLGVQYYGGPIVTLIASKQTSRYRLQSDSFEAMWIILNTLLKRLMVFYEKNSNGVPFRCSFQGPIPHQEYFLLIDKHFELRLALDLYLKMLSQRAHQFRVIQKRLLTRFKDKTPAPLAHLDTLLDGTYKQLLALGEQIENTQLALLHASTALSSGTRLINLLIKFYVSMSDDDFGILQNIVTPNVSDTSTQGWEEMVDVNICYMIKTCLSKGSKDQNLVLPPMKMDKDTNKLKKHLSLLWERLGKGTKLNLDVSSD
ncbi:protein PTHB1 isoform X2 [Hydra vulgaris]|uniref:Protein PTHB1 isoform X2 n=1 Tax=Hydra vulgaris TaxID=6087 RepID=A0ABM4C211_HYDVU